MKALFTALLAVGLLAGSAHAQGRGHGNGNGKAKGHSDKRTVVVGGNGGIIVSGPTTYTKSTGVANARRHGGVAHAYGHNKNGKHRTRTTYFYRVR